MNISNEIREVGQHLDSGLTQLANLRRKITIEIGDAYGKGWNEGYDDGFDDGFKLGQKFDTMKPKNYEILKNETKQESMEK